VEERPNTLLKTILRPVETFFEECYRTQADGLTVICTTLQQKALALGVKPEKMLFWLDGADTAGLQPLDKNQARQLCQLPAGVPIIGYVGAIFQRDAQLMATAFEAVQAQIPQAKLALIGYVNQPVEKMVKDPAAVIRTGYISFEQVNHYLSACDVCWLPYHNSAANRGRYPMKLNDYMAVARPTVATAVGDVTTMLETHPIGLLTEPTPADLAEKTVALLHNPAWQAQLGAAGRAVAENVLSWDIQTDKLEQFYGEIVEKHKK
jgi:glycosyltransferase involved in cell wall biosynthesis